MPLAPFHQGNLLSLVRMTSSIDITPPNQAFQTLPFHMLLLCSSLNESLTLFCFSTMHFTWLCFLKKNSLLLETCTAFHCISTTGQELRVNNSKCNKNSVAILQMQLYKSYLNNCKKCSEQPPGPSSTTQGVLTCPAKPPAAAHKCPKSLKWGKPQPALLRELPLREHRSGVPIPKHSKDYSTLSPHNCLNVF